MTSATAFTGRIVHPGGEGVVYGSGATKQHLAGLVARVDARRPFLIATPSVTRAGLVDDVAAALGCDPVGVFDGSQAHTPAPVVLAAAAEARQAGADCLVSVGGSSVVDLTKGVALVLAEGDDFDELRSRFRARRDKGAPPFEHQKLPHLSLPTTLSGAEFTGAAGITDPASGEKRAYLDRKLTPRWVVLDPELTHATPPDLWASTGMKVVADTIEVLCSRRATPLSDAVASGALAILVDQLARSTADPSDLDARGRCQFAVAMALPQLAAVGVGLVAALRHQLGGGLGVPHGIASTIVLPHVLRWNYPEGDGPLERAASALGEPSGAAVAGRMEALTAELGLPRRLRDVGVSHADLAGIAAHVLTDASITTNPRAVAGTDDVLEILDAAF